MSKVILSHLILLKYFSSKMNLFLFSFFVLFSWNGLCKATSSTDEECKVESFKWSKVADDSKAAAFAQAMQECHDKKKPISQYFGDLLSGASPEKLELFNAYILELSKKGLTRMIPYNDLKSSKVILPIISNLDSAIWTQYPRIFVLFMEYLKDGKLDSDMMSIFADIKVGDKFLNCKDISTIANLAEVEFLLDNGMVSAQGIAKWLAYQRSAGLYPLKIDLQKNGSFLKKISEMKDDELPEPYLKLDNADCQYIFKMLYTDMKTSPEDKQALKFALCKASQYRNMFNFNQQYVFEQEIIHPVYLIELGLNEIENPEKLIIATRAGKNYCQLFLQKYKNVLLPECVKYLTSGIAIIVAKLADQKSAGEEELCNVKPFAWSDFENYEAVDSFIKEILKCYSNGLSIRNSFGDLLSGFSMNKSGHLAFLLRRLNSEKLTHFLPFDNVPADALSIVIGGVDPEI